MSIEVFDRQKFNTIINIYGLDNRDDLDIGYADKLFTLFCPEAATHVFNILGICGMRNGVDYLVHGSIMDFDGINEW
ncbi:MAG: hypothetical protein EKK57_09815 [Proteobacteria bacterium]|nr:MAG: hypothetical protein EKK57_09815 [Pseudomonadota bacterium]